ncbi:hypothetical protein RM545_15805 [Zunongwangia sp. F260]|uniref:Uncharacterized protein n=1 Tax=Autumnicola lenta TaxID=3075593 RepID=A0ABU3CQF3_9FLAO|nr:hypothetical protein [Zunongwangia sp. F260]MDT0648160.1 hypothetical protein [Zunongwangia sp. F260]
MKTFMKRFFELQFGMKRNEVFIETLNDYPDQLLKIGEFTPKEPFTMKRSEGKIFFDVIRFQDVFNFVISSRLYNILREEKIQAGMHIELRSKIMMKNILDFK